MQKYPAVFIIGTGWTLEDGYPHEMRAADYDDFTQGEPATPLFYKRALKKTERLDKNLDTVIGMGKIAGSRTGDRVGSTGREASPESCILELPAKPPSLSPEAAKGDSLQGIIEGRIATIPNLLALVRFAFVPFIILNVLENRYLPALILFTFAWVTDGIDGWIARRFNQRSPLGALLDPFVDKVLLITVFLSLYFSGLLSLAMILLLIAKDLFLLAGFFYFRYRNRRIPLSRSRTGRYSTFLQMLFIFCVIIKNILPGGPLLTLLNPFIPPLLALTLFLALLTVMNYISLAKREEHEIMQGEAPRTCSVCDSTGGERG